MIFKYNNHEAIIVAADAIPQPYRHLLIPSANLRFTQLSFGTVLSQEIVEDGFTLWQHHFFIERQCTFHACNDRSLVSINYMIQGSPVGSLAGVGKVELTENTYQFFYIPTGEHPVTMGKGDYHCIHINLSEVFFKQLIEADSSVLNLIAALKGNRKNGIQHRTGSIDNQTNKILDIISACKTNGPQAAIFFQLKVRELLLSYFQQLEPNNIVTNKIPGKYLVQIQEIERYVSDNLGKKLCYKTIALHFNTSKSTLKRLYKKYKGLALATFMQTVKLDRSIELLEENRLTINEIADAIGYGSTSSFSRAFKEKFGCSPSEYINGRVTS